jgi:hypothetical protein
MPISFIFFSAVYTNAECILQTNIFILHTVF